MRTRQAEAGENATMRAEEQHGRRARCARGVVRGVLLGGLVLGLGTGCSLDKVLQNDEVPPTAADPAPVQTREGALRIYHGLISRFRSPFSQFVAATGSLGDELRETGNGEITVDRRFLPEGQDVEPFASLHAVRGQASQAIGLLTNYAPDERAVLGHAYALAGYAEVMLAELYCSGIPLSTLDYGGDYTYRPGSTTAEVFQHAAALFDTASTLVSDSARFVSLVAVGKARALLGLDSLAAAAAVVAAVPDNYLDIVSYTAALITGAAPGDTARPYRNFFVNPDNASNNWGYSVSDREGLNGLDYRTSGDPRSATTPHSVNGGTFVHEPTKYQFDGSSPIVLASGIEARLIGAEAALRATSNDASWLTTLNALRTDGTFDTQPTPDPDDDPANTDTLWHAGTGGVAGLAPLADPGPDGSGQDTLRVNLLFRERAFWLFLTGHRQGDLRRLIRQYGRSQETVYPTDIYGSGLEYGSDVTLPIPAQERVVNPLSHGCFSREA